MSENKHTIDEIIDLATGWLMDSWCGKNTGLVEEWERIVPLLKAAPDLLEAAVLTLARNDGPCFMSEDDWDELRAAAAKAKKGTE